MKTDKKNRSIKVLETDIAIVSVNDQDYISLTDKWRKTNPGVKRNICNYANGAQLVCLANMENLNAVLINEGLPQHEPDCDFTNEVVGTR